MSGAKQMDAPSVQALVDKLRDLTSVKFLDAGNGPVVFEVAVTSNDGKRIEKVVIWKQGDSYFARRESEPSSLRTGCQGRRRAAESGRRGERVPAAEKWQKVSGTGHAQLACATNVTRTPHRSLRADHGGRLLRSRQGRAAQPPSNFPSGGCPTIATSFLPLGWRKRRVSAEPAFHLAKRSTTCAACRSSRASRPSSSTSCVIFVSPATCSPSPEGTPLFAGEPMLTVRAPLIEAQIPETYLLSAITFQSLIATKAARVVEAGGGRDVVEFGTRRAHTPEAGVLGARAAYIGGCAGTSNALAGFRYGIPVFGTAAHSWVMSFPSEKESFRQLQKLLGPHTVQLIDTYDTLEGARRAAALGRPLWGVRLDSGDVISLARNVRAILDEAGLHDAKIMATRRSGRIQDPRYRRRGRADRRVRRGHGAGHLGRCAVDGRRSTSWSSWICAASSASPRNSARTKRRCPGAKQIFRLPDHDVLARAGECCAGLRSAAAARDPRWRAGGAASRT